MSTLGREGLTINFDSMSREAIQLQNRSSLGVNQGSPSINGRQIAERCLSRGAAVSGSLYVKYQALNGSERVCPPFSGYQHWICTTLLRSKIRRSSLSLWVLAKAERKVIARASTIFVSAHERSKNNLRLRPEEGGIARRHQLRDCE
jgi:hypothetical protein